MKFKVGDRVKIIANMGGNKMYDKFIEKTYNIEDIDIYNLEFPYKLYCYLNYKQLTGWCDKELELATIENWSEVLK